MYDHGQNDQDATPSPNPYMPVLLLLQKRLARDQEFPNIRECQPMVTFDPLKTSNDINAAFWQMVTIRTKFVQSKNNSSYFFACVNTKSAVDLK
jgi:hypothetical protein